MYLGCLFCDYGTAETSVLKLGSHTKQCALPKSRLRQILDLGTTCINVKENHQLYAEDLHESLVVPAYFVDM
jgi:hypothetical protein